ncbi:MAG: TlpA family protein disulfide reductase [Cyclobacteriaceae bacterium]|nr:TlpA family protein disulfide reductase [Cyclobacteriaceae bacterium]
MRIVWMAGIAALLIASCQGPKEGIKVVGKVANPIEGESILILKMTTEGLKAIDSVRSDKDGDFTAYLPSKSHDFYRINFYNRQNVNLAVTGEETLIEIQADGDRPNGYVKISGSWATDLMWKMDSVSQRRQADIQQLNNEALQARAAGDVAAMNALNERFLLLNGRHIRSFKSFIMASVPSLAAIYGMSYLDIDSEIQFADSLAQQLQVQLPDHILTADFIDRVNVLRVLAIGADAPEISLPTPEGEVLTLSSLRGNYVLIDFWASWCRPCRAENPNVVRLYNQYKDKNFEILGVALDRTRDAWLEAIEADGLTWKHVSDIKYYNCQAALDYSISAIPATYLIGPEGKIIAKGLRGPSLEAKLAELFGPGK